MSAPQATTTAPANKVDRKSSRAQVPPPPATIYDAKTGRTFTRDKLIGKGGFANVYRVIELGTNESLACKVIHKSTLTRTKSRRKLQSEIVIHKSMVHESIVAFRHYFEDTENVYIILELCSCQSLMELHRRRGPLTEEEVRYYLLQILDGVEYMHKSSIIHRDIKLGNLMLSHDMKIKVGDFGLAALMDRLDGNRRTTICGTPNYIAPEIINPDTNGHSFEVDTWAIGVVVFTLLVGKPPFETQSVKSTYSRIRKNEYSFPESSGVSENAQSLVSELLHPQPFQRPTLDEVRRHPFVVNGHLPTSLSPETRRKRPTFPSHLMHIPQAPSIIDPSVVMAKMASPRNTRRPLGLVNGDTNTNKTNRNKKSAVLQHERHKDWSQPEIYRGRQEDGWGTLNGVAGKSGDVVDPKRTRRDRMKPRVQARTDSTRSRNSPAPELKENLDPRSQSGSTMMRRDGREKGKAVKVELKSEHKQYEQPNQDQDEGVQNDDNSQHKQQSSRAPPSRSLGRAQQPASEPESTRLFRMECLVHRLENIEANTRGGTGAGAPSCPLTEMPETPALLWITKWVDYSNKYGFGFQLADGSIGVSFNDATRMVCWNNKAEYTGVSGECHQFRLDSAPLAYEKKVTILRYFKSYMHKNLLESGASISQRNNPNMAETTRMISLQCWYRRKDAIVFHLTNFGVQINFTDHTKIILCPESHTLTYIDKSRIHHTYTWRDVLACDQLDHPVVRRLPVVDEVLKTDAELVRPKKTEPPIPV